MSYAMVPTEPTTGYVDLRRGRRSLRGFGLPPNIGQDPVTVTDNTLPMLSTSNAASSETAAAEAAQIAAQQGAAQQGTQLPLAPNPMATPTVSQPGTSMSTASIFGSSKLPWIVGGVVVIGLLAAAAR